jgi:Mrp family chromosome partitioning ATPase
MRLSSVVAVTGPGRNDPRDMNTLVEHLDELDCQLLGLIENRAA